MLQLAGVTVSRQLWRSRRHGSADREQFVRPSVRLAVLVIVRINIQSSYRRLADMTAAALSGFHRF